MRVLAALGALALLGFAVYCFTFLGRSSDTPASTYVVLGFVALALAAPLAWLATRAR